MFELWERKTYTQVASQLNSHNITTPRGNRWYASTVRTALLRDIANGRNGATTNAFIHACAQEGDGETTDERNHESALTSHLSGSGLPGIPDFSTPTAGRGVKKSGGMPMPSNIKEAERMLNLFCSVGARSFVVTKLDIAQQIIWGKTYSALELSEKLPAMVLTAAERKSYPLPDGSIVSAGENLIVRPSGPDVCFVQLDDLSAEQLDRVRGAAFLIHATSPGDHQAWIAASGIGKSQSKEFIRRVRAAVGDVDKSASGASRMCGSENFKLKYAPEFPMVTMVQGVPGRVMTPERLQEMGLLAEPEPVRISPGATRVSRDLNGIHPWPSYDICLMRARKRRMGRRTVATQTFRSA